MVLGTFAETKVPRQSREAADENRQAKEIDPPQLRSSGRKNIFLRFR
jgi:hypothetical protein